MMKLLNLKTSFDKGKNAEKLAIKFLKNRQWEILVNNYKTKVGEIDIIAQKDNLLVAFEVKYRKNENILAYTIFPKQRKRILDTFNLFLKAKKEYYNYNLRIDAILINKDHEIIHIENAWEEKGF